jgi:hypothetical protein
VPTTEDGVVRAYEVFRAWLSSVELLTDEPDGEFGVAGSVVEDLLSIVAVHPMREAAVRRLLQRVGASWGVVEEMMEAGQLAEVQYGPNRYYVRPTGRTEVGEEA